MNVRSRAAACLAVVSAASCGGGDPIRGDDLFVGVTPSETTVDLGRAFELEVVRVWRRDLSPEPWDDRTLAPLTVALEEVAVRSDAERVEERRRYRAHAFQLGEITLPPLSFAAQPPGGAAPRVVSGDPVALLVRGSLDPKAPGDAELPAEQPDVGTPAVVWWLLGLAAAIGAPATIALRRRRRAHAEVSAPPVAPPPQGPGPHVAALERLREMRRRPLSDGAESGRDFAEIAEVLRGYVGARFGVRIRERTSEEIVAATATSVAAETLGTLADALSRCDLVKFAARTPDADALDAAVDAAERFVTATASSGEPR